MRKFQYLKLCLFITVLFSISGCLSTEERLQMENEKKRIADCAKNINFVDENSTNKPYKIIDIVVATLQNGQEEYAFNYLKRKACKKKGDALTTPEMQRGPIHTTYTSKIIVWSTSEIK